MQLVLSLFPGIDLLGRQTRLRHIQFGHVDAHIIRPVRTQPSRPVTHVPTVTTHSSGTGDRHCRHLAKQGFTTLPLRSLTPAARRRVIGNGVPLTIGLALARAVTASSSTTPADCICLCGRPVTATAIHATPACRKRMERRRHSHTRIVTLDNNANGAQTTHATSGSPQSRTSVIGSDATVESSHRQRPSRDTSGAMVDSGPLFQSELIK